MRMRGMRRRGRLPVGVGIVCLTIIILETSLFKMHAFVLHKSEDLASLWFTVEKELEGLISALSPFKFLQEITRKLELETVISVCAWTE